MTRKRFVKLLMGHGVSRNRTNGYARLRDEDESYLELYSDIMWGYDGTGWLDAVIIPFNQYRTKY